jgi:type I restriction enzyme S subunit
MMASEWRTAKLDELVSFKTGKLDSNAAVPDGDYPFFTCSQDTLWTNTYSFDTECVLLGGNNANGIFPLKYFHGKFDAYQRTYIIKPRDSELLTTKFLYYALRPKLSELRSFSTGAATKFLTLTILNETAIEIPSLEEQRRIAGILSAYDELIENNQRRIRILEDMARSLYREWFVQFCYPSHESIQLVDSPLGRIPQGWGIKKLGDIALVNRTQINAKNAPDELHYIDIASVSPGQIDSVTTYAFADAPGRARRIVQHGDVLWSCVRPNRRSHALVMHSETNTIASTGFAVLTAKTVPFTFLYFATTTDDFVSYLTNNASGAAYPAVTATTFEKAELLIPSLALLDRFGEATIAMAEQAHTLQRQTTNLRCTRDLLLPRLLSGQVSISDVVSEAVL